MDHSCCFLENSSTDCNYLCLRGLPVGLHWKLLQVPSKIRHSSADRAGELFDRVDKTAVLEHFGFLILFGDT